MKEKISFKQYLKTQLIIFGALLIGQINFMGVSFFFNWNKQATQNNLKIIEMMTKVLPALVLLAIFLSFFLPKQMLSKLKAEESLSKKLNQYTTINIIRYIILEFVFMIITIFYFLYNVPLFLLLGGAIFLVFLVNYPSKFKLINELKLNQDEIKIIDNENVPFIEKKNYNDTDTWNND